MIPSALLPLGNHGLRYFLQHSIRGFILQLLFVATKISTLGIAALAMNIVLPKFMGDFLPSEFGYEEQDPLEALLLPPALYWGGRPGRELVKNIATLLATLLTVFVCTFWVDCGISFAGLVAERLASRRRRYLLWRLPFVEQFDDLERPQQEHIVRAVIVFEITTAAELDQRIEMALQEKRTKHEEGNRPG